VQLVDQTRPRRFVSDGPRNRLLVENEHLHAGADQLLRDRSLQIGKADYLIGLELEDPLDLSRRKRGNFRLLPRFFRGQV
jgi:hypothetical protein